jgi:hypothetical protein
VVGETLALTSGSPLDALTFFWGSPVSPEDDYDAWLREGRFDPALIYCCLLADDASQVLATFATLEPHARRAVVAALRQ